MNLYECSMCGCNIVDDCGICRNCSDHLDRMSEYEEYEENLLYDI